MSIIALFLSVLWVNVGMSVTWSWSPARVECASSGSRKSKLVQSAVEPLQRRFGTFFLHGAPGKAGALELLELGVDVELELSEGTWGA